MVLSHLRSIMLFTKWNVTFHLHFIHYESSCCIYMSYYNHVAETDVVLSLTLFLLFSGLHCFFSIADIVSIVQLLMLFLAWSLTLFLLFDCWCFFCCSVTEISVVRSLTLFILLNLWHCFFCSIADVASVVSDVPLIGSLGNAKNETFDFVIHWLDNKEFHATLEAEKLIDELLHRSPLAEHESVDSAMGNSISSPGRFGNGRKSGLPVIGSDPAITGRLVCVWRCEGFLVEGWMKGG